CQGVRVAGTPGRTRDRIAELLIAEVIVERGRVCHDPPVSPFRLQSELERIEELRLGDIEFGRATGATVDRTAAIAAGVLSIDHEVIGESITQPRASTRLRLVILH